MRLAVAFFVATLAFAGQAFGFGALAIDAPQGPAYGFAIDYSSEDGARAAALGKCGSKCQTVVVFNNTCAAYAADQTRGSSVFGWGYAPSQENASALALGYCRQYGGKSCKIRVWACESSRGTHGTARADNKTLAQLTPPAPAPAPPPPVSVQPAPAPVPSVSAPPKNLADAEANRRAVEEAFSRFSRPPAPPPAVAPAPSPAPPPVAVNVPPTAPAVLPKIAEAGVRRIALVIGNDRYENLEPLQKAVNDARAVSDALSSIGFDVIRVENAVRRMMNQKLVEFTGKVTPGDTAFFFYSGHGVEIRGENFLLPVDMPKVGERQEGIVTGEGIPTTNIIEQLQARGAKVTMMVLDACRENPFAKQGTRGVGATRGLAQITAPEGVFVLYSAGVGQTALDRLSNSDADPNSIFTRKFIQMIKTPGLSVQEMAKRTQFGVRELALTVNHPQMPAYYDQILGQFSLVPAR